MYKIPTFTETNSALVWAFMQAHPFVTLIGNDGNNSIATQIPVMMRKEGEKIILTGHIMRNTDHCLAFEKNQQVLVLFMGASCYVSASWYSERGHGSTFNYMTVHARGKMSFLNDTQTVQLLTALTHQYEDIQQKPELVETMTEQYMRSNVKAILGFDILLDSIEPIFKLSQNRDNESYQKIVNNLNAQDDAQAKIIASEMIKRREVLF